MALTSGAKKLGITAIVAAAIIGGGFYFQKHKVQKPLSIEAPVATVAPATPAYFDPNMPAQKIEVAVPAVEAPPVKKQHVAKAVKKAHRSSASHGGSQQEPTHETLHKELTSDQKALKDMAGDKL
jgi:hypothetical protein